MRVLVLGLIEWASLGIGGALFAAGAVVLILSLRTTGQIVEGYKAVAAELRRERDEARAELKACRDREDISRGVSDDE